MDALEMLLGRHSVDSLVDPAPQGEQLMRILQTAMAAPDHGKMRPWRYVLIEGDMRKEFARLLEKALSSQTPPVPEAKIEKRVKKFMSTPLIIALGMRLKENEKIPVIEQQMAAAAAYMNVLNALYAEGFGAVWISGDMAYNKKIRKKLGFSSPDQLAGYLLVGTPEKPSRMEEKKRPDVKGFIAKWEGEAPEFVVD
ncbi:nitroreductase family protein [Entomobacter blattae]|uniref:Putative NAD(P)H nitroreductase n=1 Tax=Entomobacter blattae TaxID=2762277 RepID=A0A7H1NUM5_9PROT|nr:nitroreductase [Entomobacter blattae]QNT79485.1 Putative NAD(P)H nitroreductase YdjA [Entomobacter blattae]